MCVNAQLWDSYANACFRFEGEWRAKQYAIITAWNPRSIHLSNDYNIIKNNELIIDIYGRSKLKVVVGDANFDWYEESYAVEMTLLEACDLGQKYHQNAIYYVDNGVLLLVPCDGERQPKNLGLLSQYVAD
ncbi:DUF3293 domain-containing protein [Vibrio methylphosphonaticus]|uniref:DUF3293 domain-containing protein n=1 Tax=Vibrio methylphosphonaticus TaxID=2946866 RepID=UPI00202A74DA|nr:DUF3293 domain-containing protein [Vibrio methylphosphonaticus]MCL9773362.1 DUF3293 domain-containing protein [Vibrio methylphosphonaticus]